MTNTLDTHPRWIDSTFEYIDQVTPQNYMNDGKGPFGEIDDRHRRLLGHRIDDIRRAAEAGLDDKEWHVIMCDFVMYLADKVKRSLTSTRSDQKCVRNALHLVDQVSRSWSTLRDFAPPGDHVWKSTEHQSLLSIRVPATGENDDEKSIRIAINEALWFVNAASDAAPSPEIACLLHYGGLARAYASSYAAVKKSGARLADLVEQRYRDRVKFANESIDQLVKLIRERKCRF